MFKAVLFVTLCIIVLAECKPAQDNKSFSNENHRVARSAQHAQKAIQMAGQMADEVVEVANKGINILSSVAKGALRAGTSIATDTVKSVGSMI